MPTDRRHGPGRLGRFAGLKALAARAASFAARAVGEHRCPACLALVPGPSPEGEAGLCEPCAAELDLRLGGFCPGCGALYADTCQEPHLCGECLKSPRPWQGFYFLGAYDGLLAELIKAYKFNQGLGYGRLIEGLAARIFTARAEAVPDLIAPVPLHPRRLVERGYNQSLELSRALARAIERPLEVHALTRLRYTVPQSRLGAKQRLTNLRGAFAADAALVHGKRVLLCDDVMTTGATLDECARALARAGAIGVDVLVLART